MPHPTPNPLGTHKWQKIRKKQLKIEPQCYYCGATATQVDHLTPRSKGIDPYDEDNLVSACQRCNASKQGRDAREFARAIATRTTRPNAAKRKDSFSRSARPTPPAKGAQSPQGTQTSSDKWTGIGGKRDADE